MKSTTDFLTGFLLGSVVAAGIVLLLNPGSGEDNRTGIKNWAARLQEEVRGASEQKRIELEQQLSMLREPRRSESE
jgi:gas vesicle protein